MTQAEIDANGSPTADSGNLTNTGTADSNESEPDTDTLDIPIIQNPLLSVVKSSTATEVTAAGQVVDYSYLVSNDGNQTLTDVTVTEDVATSIDLSVPVSGTVNAVIYNVIGQKVRTLVNEQLPAGYYTITWDGLSELGQPVTSGVYFCRVNAGTFNSSIKTLLLK